MDIKKFLKQFRHFSLNKEEKEEVKDGVMNYVEKNPVRVDAGSRRIYQKQQTTLLQFFKSLFLTKKFMTGTIVAAVMVLLSGGTSFAAQDALPGDALYPFKTQVNEKVVSTLQVSDKAKAEYQAELAERRLEEVEQVAAEGKSNTEISEETRVKFKTHVESVQDRVERLREKGNAQAAAAISSKLDASLETHEKILASLDKSVKTDVEAATKLNSDSESETSTDEEQKEGVKTKSKKKSKTKTKAGADLSSILETVKKKRAEVSSSSEGDEKEESSQEEFMKAAAEGRMNATKNKIEEIESFINKHEDRYSQELLSETRAQLDVAKSILDEGEKEKDSGNFKIAFKLFQESHFQAQRAKMTLVSKGKSKIEDPKEKSNEKEEGETSTKKLDRKEIMENLDSRIEGKTKVEIKENIEKIKADMREEARTRFEAREKNNSEKESVDSSAEIKIDSDSNLKDDHERIKSDSKVNVETKMGI